MGLVNFDLGDVGGLIVNIREAITGKKIEDPAEQAKMLLQLEQLETELKKGQMAINAKEAEHKSIFVAGWRPYIGWIGGTALLYSYILQPLIGIALQANGVNVKLPELDIFNLMLLIAGMLGFGGFRTFEKVKGVSGGR